MALGFTLAEQELKGQFRVIHGQYFFDGAGLQCLRQRQARCEDTAQQRELVRQAFQFLLLGGGGAGTLPPGELLGIPPHIVELGAMRLAHPAYRIVVQDMRARARLLKTLQDLLGAFHHPVEGLGNHGKRADRMPLGNAMVRHGDSLRNRDANGRPCAHQHTKLPRRFLSQSSSLPNVPIGVWEARKAVLFSARSQRRWRGKRQLRIPALAFL